MRNLGEDELEVFRVDGSGRVHVDLRDSGTHLLVSGGCLISVVVHCSGNKWIVQKLLGLGVWIIPTLLENLLHDNALP